MSYLHTIKPGSSVSLKDLDPDFAAGLSKAEVEEQTAKLGGQSYEEDSHI